MELESEGGAKISIENESTTELGRDLGLGDRSISRLHLSLRSTTDPNSPNPRISFEVIGKNPVLVHTDSSGGGERIYRNSERGELGVGDKFTLSLKNPSFFVVKAREEEEAAAERRRVLDAVERREKRTLERRREKKEEGVEEEFDLDISEIDPVKKFGFLVKGHEFDRYPKINFKHWNWFLDEPGKNADNDETDDEQDTRRSKGKMCGKRKMKNGGDVEEEWSGESDDENETLMKGGSTKYSTRSRDPKKLRKDVKTQKDEVEEDDETLGGFIVNEEEEEETEEGESEEEFEEEEEDEDE